MARLWMGPAPVFAIAIAVTMIVVLLGGCSDSVTEVLDDGIPTERWISENESDQSRMIRATPAFVTNVQILAEVDAAIETSGLTIAQLAQFRKDNDLATLSRIIGIEAPDLRILVDQYKSNNDELTERFGSAHYFVDVVPLIPPNSGGYGTEEVPPCEEACDVAYVNALYDNRIEYAEDLQACTDSDTPLGWVGDVLCILHAWGEYTTRNNQAAFHRDICLQECEESGGNVTYSGHEPIDYCTILQRA